MEEKKRCLRPMRTKAPAGYIYRMTMRRNEMSTTMVERNCAGCLLRTVEHGRAGGPALKDAPLDPEDASERQLERLERRFGPNWKW